MDDKLIVVCDKCKRASCIKGLFYCDSHQTAGMIQVPISKLKEFALEHSDNWEG